MEASALLALVAPLPTLAVRSPQAARRAMALGAGGAGGVRFATGGGVAGVGLLAGAAAGGTGAGAGVEATGGAGAGDGAAATGGGFGAGAAGDVAVRGGGAAASGSAVDALFSPEQAVAAKHIAAIAHCNTRLRRIIRYRSAR